MSQTKKLILVSIYRLFLSCLVVIAFSNFRTAQAQNNLYWNNTASTIGNWNRTTPSGNWRAGPSSGSFTTETTLNDIANFNSNTAFSGAHDIFTGAGQSAFGMIFGVGTNSMGPFRIRANTNTTFDRTFTLGAGGITVNPGVQGVSFSNNDVLTSAFTGNLNLLLQSSQTWTNHSTSPLDVSGRILGIQGVSLTKAGSGTLILSGENNLAASGSTTGFAGKILVNQGTLVIRHENALGRADSSSSSGRPINPIADTVIASGATLDLSGTLVNRSEIITVSGAGVGNNGVIVNTGAATASTGDVRLAGNATIGGNNYWSIGTTVSGPSGSPATLTMNAFHLNKVGTSNIAIANTSIIGGGDLIVNEGTLTLIRTSYTGSGSARVANGANLGFNQVSSIGLPIVMAGNNQILNASGLSNVASNLTLNGATTINLQSASSTLNLTGLTSGSGSIFVTGTSIDSRLSIRLDGSNYTGTSINVDNATLTLRSASSISANINLNQVGGTEASMRGEAQTSGRFTFSGNTLLTFDPSTTGTDGHLRVGSTSRVGSTPMQVAWSTRLNNATGIVVLESAANDIVSNQYSLKDIRGSLTTNGTRLLFDHEIANLRWRGNEQVNATLWDKQTSQNWLNASSNVADVFYDSDAPVFDDSVGSGSNIVNIATALNPSSVRFDNSLVNYTITPTTTSGQVDSVAATLTKTGTGIVNLNTIQNGRGHRFGSTNVQAGVLNIGYVGSGPGVFSSLGATTVAGGAILRDRGEFETTSVSATITVESGGVFEVVRSVIPSGSINRTVLSSVTSGTGNVILRGIEVPTMVDTFANYWMSDAGGNFGGTITLDRSRLNVREYSSSATTKFVVPQGSQFFGTAQNSILEIAGTGAVGSTSQTGSNGALRLAGDMPSSSSIVLQANSRISGEGRISASISGVGALEIGTPDWNSGLGIVLTGTNSYSGTTTIQNTRVTAASDRAFSTGNVFVGGNLANSTVLAVERGTTIANNIFVSTTAGIENGGVIQGGPRSTNATGIGILTGAINLQGSMPANRAHFGYSSDSGFSGQIGGALKINGPINIDNPSTQAVSYFDFSGSQAVMEFGGGGGNYTKFELRRGDIRLGANDGLNRGVELITNTTVTTRNDIASLDMNGFDQTLSRINKQGPFASSFTIVNRGSKDSTLTILGNGNSEINRLPFAAGNSALHIIKNGSGKLALYGLDFNNPGTYTINGGEFSFPDTIQGSIIVNGGTITGTGTAMGNSNLTAGGISPGNSPGTLTFGGVFAMSGNAFYNWELMSLGGSANAFTDKVIVGGSLNLVGLDRMDINVIGLADNLPAQININAFDPSKDYKWTLFETANAILGFSQNDFVINTMGLSNNTPFGGSFFVGLDDNNTDIMLNYSAIAVPEPSTFVLLATGIGVCWFSKRQSKSCYRVVCFRKVGLSKLPSSCRGIWTSVQSCLRQN